MTTQEHAVPVSSLSARSVPGRPLLKTLGLAALSGALLAGALPKLDWGWMAWFALVPMLGVFPLRNARRAFAHGMMLAAFYSLGMVYWVAVFASHLIGPALSVVGWALLTLCESFFFGLWALGAHWLRGHPNPWAWRLGVPCLWVIVAEWWRQLGSLGLSWGDLAYTQHLALPILQVTKLTGIWGLGFLIVLVNVALAEVLAIRAAEPTPVRLGSPPLPVREGLWKWRKACLLSESPSLTGEGGEPVSREGFFFPLATAALVVLALGYGFVTMKTEHLRPEFVAAALQGDINQNVNQDPAYVERVMGTFIGQSRIAAAHGAALTVWPETAYPGYLQGDIGPRPRLAAEAVRSHQVMVIGGIEYDEAQRKNANSLFLMNAEGNVTGSYQKRQLVPFGEFVPGRRWIPFLESLHVTTFDMKPGADTQALLDGGPVVGKIGATVCFESSYPRYLREQVARGAGLLVISTDDTWFGRTSAARQHSAIAAVRAAETDRYLIRSAATGVSQVIDPTGRVLAEADLFRPAVVWAPVQSRATLTPYARWGDWFVGFCALLLAGVCLRRP